MYFAFGVKSTGIMQKTKLKIVTHRPVSYVTQQTHISPRLIYKYTHLYQTY